MLQISQMTNKSDRCDYPKAADQYSQTLVMWMFCLCVMIWFELGDIQRYMIKLLKLPLMTGKTTLQLQQHFIELASQLDVFYSIWSGFYWWWWCSYVMASYDRFPYDGVSLMVYYSALIFLYRTIAVIFVIIKSKI